MVPEKRLGPDSMGLRYVNFFCRACSRGSGWCAVDQVGGYTDGDGRGDGRRIVNRSCKVASERAMSQTGGRGTRRVRRLGWATSEKVGTEGVQLFGLGPKLGLYSHCGMSDLPAASRGQ